MRETSPTSPQRDPLSEGARARAHGRPKDACPYPAGSPERRAWLEAYDGIPAEPAAGSFPAG
jgi:ribosome modulation factor